MLFSFKQERKFSSIINCLLLAQASFFWFIGVILRMKFLIYTCLIKNAKLEENKNDKKVKRPRILQKK